MRFKFWLLIIDFCNCWHALFWCIRAPKQPTFLKKEGNMIERPCGERTWQESETPMHPAQAVLRSVGAHVKRTCHGPICGFVVSLAPNQIVILHIVLTQCRKRIQKCRKKATSANPSNPLFHCHSTLSSATRLPSDRSCELVMSRQLSRHRKMDVYVDEYG